MMMTSEHDHVYTRNNYTKIGVCMYIPDAGTVV
jgi:hypothetical protein